MRLLVKVPDPVPSVVLELAVVGFWTVLQQTPLAIIAAPPSVVIFPPLEAVVLVIAVSTVVVRVGKVANVVAVTSLP